MLSCYFEMLYFTFLGFGMFSIFLDDLDSSYSMFIIIHHNFLSYRCKEITDPKIDKWNDFVYDADVSGRYVTVFLPGIRFLILCEVKIFGTKKGTITVLVLRMSCIDRR